MAQEYPLDIRCAFCGIHRKDARILVAGPDVYICDECIDIAHSVVTKERARVARDEAANAEGGEG